MKRNTTHFLIFLTIFVFIVSIAFNSQLESECMFTKNGQKFIRTSVLPGWKSFAFNRPHYFPESLDRTQIRLAFLFSSGATEIRDVGEPVPDQHHFSKCRVEYGPGSARWSQKNTVHSLQGKKIN